MIQRQQKALILVALACLVVLVCTTQRMAGLHALVMKNPAISQTFQQDDAREAQVSPCELSAKTLLASPPILFEGALVAMAVLMMLLTAMPAGQERRWPVRVISPPRLRIHLRLCVFRE